MCIKTVCLRQDGPNEDRQEAGGAEVKNIAESSAGSVGGGRGCGRKVTGDYGVHQGQRAADTNRKAGGSASKARAGGARCRKIGPGMY